MTHDATIPPQDPNPLDTPARRPPTRTDTDQGFRG